MLFDFDGTLVATESVGPRVFSELVSGFANSSQLLGDFASSWRRLENAREITDIFDEAFGSTSSELLHTFQERFRTEALLVEESPGATDLLRQLANEGVSTGIVSHATASDLLPQLGARDWLTYFEVVVPFEEVGLPKPNPAGYLKAISRLGAEPSHTLVVEDSLNGLVAAKAAGAHAIHVTWQHGPCDCPIADKHALTFADLAPIIFKATPPTERK